MIKDILNQMNQIKENINNNHSPEILFAMNQTYRRLDDELKELIKNLDVNYERID